MTIEFSDEAWEDYQYWLQKDRSILKRINTLIRDIQRNPYEGIGKPEALKYHLAGFWSRRINEEHRIVYTVIEDRLLIAQCRYHY